MIALINWLDNMIYIALLLSVCFISCDKKNKTIKEHKYPSGKIQYRSYYTNNKLDSINEYFENGKIKINTRKITADKQYQIIYDESGKNHLEGWTIRKDNKYVRDGWWNQIMNGEKKKIEYILINDTTRVNQLYSYNLDGSLSTKESHYYKINLPDTIEVNKLYKFTVELISPIISEKYFTALKLSDKITSDYLNSWQAENNYQIKAIKINLWEISHTFTQKGDFIIRGFILRRYLTSKLLPDDMMEIIEYEDMTYLKKDIYVK